MNRLKMTMLTCVVATVLTTLVLTPKVAGAAQLTCGTWSVVSSPNAGLGSNDLDGVAAVSASNGWAVGYSFNTTSNDYQTLIEHWNGTSWSVVPSPNVGLSDNELDGVAAVSASNVWAVGNYFFNSNVFQTLIEHWNGTSWSIIPSPNVGSDNNYLNGVARVPGSSKVWAVGNFKSSGIYQTLTEFYC
jgi:hypothetical protein